MRDPGVKSPVTPDNPCRTHWHWPRRLDRDLPALVVTIWRVLRWVSEVMPDPVAGDADVAASLGTSLPDELDAIIQFPTVSMAWTMLIRARNDMRCGDLQVFATFASIAAMSSEMGIDLKALTLAPPVLPDGIKPIAVFVAAPMIRSSGPAVSFTFRPRIPRPTTARVRAWKPRKAHAQVQN